MSDTLYQPLRSWQTRIIRLHPGDAEEVLRIDLLVAGLIHGEGIALDMDDEYYTYEAISYVWGERVFSEHIVCNDSDFYITKSLSSALQQFRYTDRPRYLWVDQLSINQFDIVEKAEQVRKMFQIYSKATAVLVWLGNELLHTREAIGAFMDQDTPQEQSHDEGSELYAALSELCQRPWAKRAWIQQEVYAARCVRIFCGSCEFTLEIYRAAAEFLSSATISEHAKSDLAVLQKLYTRRSSTVVTNTTTDSYQSISGLFQPNSLESVLEQSWSLHASNPRDRIYALLGLSECAMIPSSSGFDSAGSGEVSGVRVDYTKPVRDVYMDVTRYLLNRDRSLRILAYLKRTTNPKIEQLSLPSWTLDFGEARLQAVEPRKDGAGILELQSAASGDLLMIQGIVVARIESIVERRRSGMFSGNKSPFWRITTSSHLRVTGDSPRRRFSYSQKARFVVHERYKEHDHYRPDLEGIELGDLLVLADSIDSLLCLRDTSDGYHTIVCVPQHTSVNPSRQQRPTLGSFDETGYYELQALLPRGCDATNPVTSFLDHSQMPRCHYQTFYVR